MARAFKIDSTKTLYDTLGQSELSQAEGYVALLCADNTSLRLELLDTTTLTIKISSSLQTDDLPKSDARMVMDR